MEDADNIRYDPKRKEVYVGYGSGALRILDAQSGRPLGDIRVPGHPEAFQLEAAGSRLFVNVPSAHEIIVMDRTRRTVLTHWRTSGASANFPMALDEDHARLFVGCRSPARLLVYDTHSGNELAALPIAGDTDDVFYDRASRRIYASCGAGFLSIIEQKDPDHYALLAEIPTAPGARTSLFVPALGCLYLAVPHRGSQEAEVRVYAVSGEKRSLPSLQQSRRHR